MIATTNLTITNQIYGSAQESNTSTLGSQIASKPILDDMGADYPTPQLKRKKLPRGRPGRKCNSTGLRFVCCATFSVAMNVKFQV